jgi:hypothetical protein
MYDKCVRSLPCMHCETFEILPSTADWNSCKSGQFNINGWNRIFNINEIIHLVNN